MNRAGARTAGAPFRLAVLLAVIAGYVDSYAFITYRAYVSFMSGNTTATGAALGHGAFAPALHSGIPIVSFVVGGFAGTLLATSDMRRGSRWAFVIVATLLSAG